MPDMDWAMPDMDILMVTLDTMDTTLARGLLMPSPRPRLMLPFSMVPTDMVDMAKADAALLYG